SVSCDSGFVCAYIAPVVTCTSGSIAAAASATIIVSVTAPSTSGSYASTAVVDPTNVIAERDESNNSAGATVEVPRADLTLSIGASASSVDDGGPLTYYLDVDNPGPGVEASNVVVRYTLPAGATFDGA